MTTRVEIVGTFFGRTSGTSFAHENIPIAKGRNPHKTQVLSAIRTASERAIQSIPMSFFIQNPKYPAYKQPR